MKFEGVFHFGDYSKLESISSNAWGFSLSSDKNFVTLTNDFKFEYKTYVNINCETFFEYCNFDRNSIFSSDFGDFVSKSELDIGFFFNRDQSFSLARNLFGTVPIYYLHVPNNFIAFSTSLSSLVQMPTSQDYLDINLDRITSHCTFGMDSGLPYDESTFYKHIHSILPGHILHVTKTGVKSEKYLTFDIDQWNSLSTPEEYANQLLNSLKNSVNKAACNGNIASHLSGGMDSSSISSLVKLLFPNKPLVTLYADTNTDLNRESNYASLVAEKINSKHFHVNPSTDDFGTLSTIIKEYGFPECSLTSPDLNTTMLSLAKSQGCNVVLNGLDGDTIIGAGEEYLLEELVEKEDWDEIRSILKKRSQVVKLNNYYKNWDQSSSEEKYILATDQFLSHYLSQIRIEYGFPKMLKSFLTVRRNFKLRKFFILRKLLNKLQQYGNNKIHKNSILKDRYIKTNKGQSTAPPKYTNSTNKQGIANISNIFKRLSIQNNENHFALNNIYGIQSKMPMYDKAIVEICASTPNKFKYSNGFGRKHFRDAMKGILPEQVKERVDKGIFSLYARESILRMAEQAKDFLTDDHEVWEYIDIKEFNEMKKILGQDSQNLKLYNRPQFHIMRTISLAIWLSWLSEIRKKSIMQLQ